MDIKEQILTALGLSAETVDLAYQAKLEDGTIIVSEGDTLTEGGDVSVLATDGSTMKLPAGEYKVEDGTTFTVVEEGIVDSITTATEESEETEEVEAGKDKEKKYEDEDAPAEAVVEEVIDEVGGAVAEVAEAIDDATGDEITPAIAEQAAEIAVAIVEEKIEEVAMAKQIRVILEATKKELTSLKSELKETKDKVKELSDMPSDEGIKLNKFSSNNGIEELSKTEYNSLTSSQRFYYNLKREKNRLK